MAVRNLSAGHEAKEAIMKRVPNAKVDAMELDLSSMASVRKFASKFDSLGLPLNLLINNAGVMANVHAFKGQHRAAVCYKPCGYNSLSAYGQSKLANVLHSNELARLLKQEKVEITANSLHPGAIATNLFRHHSFVNGLVAALGKHVMKNVEQGAATTCYVALHPDVKGMTGKYYADCNLAEISLQAKDQELANNLWDFTLEIGACLGLPGKPLVPTGRVTIRS
ncbi:UNVERIFIED_CONTAM: Short-chain dehydrogenase, chloroplastic [Sesamum radiatum]|uniref:Short-chain dehydrogenase, chloroplastic n=1 Tax=Sesamum radiatum TaxID=300843 RepID=A0AAW2JYI0_SESRA